MNDQAGSTNENTKDNEGVGSLAVQSNNEEVPFQSPLAGGSKSAADSSLTINYDGDNEELIKSITVIIKGKKYEITASSCCPDHAWLDINET